MIPSITLRRALAAALPVVVLVAACGRTEHAAPPDPLRAAMDTTVDPGVDFFQYAEGGWIAQHPIPASEASWGIGKEIYDELYAKLRTINEQAAAAHAAAGSDQQKIGDFWLTGMDSVHADSLGVRPLADELARIDSVRTPQQALDVAFALRPLGTDAFFDVSVYQDEKNSSEMSVHLSQAGLGLPDRDFYFNPDSGVAKTRAEYVAHLMRLLWLMHDSTDAMARADRVMAFETALAKASRKLEDLRDPVKNYNKMSPADVTSKETPAIQWTDRLTAWQLHPQQVIVGQPEFFGAVNGLVTKTPVPVLRDYLTLRLVSDYSPFLSTAFVNEDFAFTGKVLNGQKEIRPRWKRVLDAEEDAMGMILGRIFVQAYFPEAAKKRYVALVHAIETAYAARIERLTWMSPPTKAMAQRKLAAITAKVGYPDKWKDYSALTIGRESYAQNMMHAARWKFDDMIKKFGKPVDRTEWMMTPQTYNAYYYPFNNEIVLPAAQFAVPGIADSMLDDALVYGYAAASTIGHEITHGFDDEGRQFDAQGNLKDWWTPADAKQFNARAQVMRRQFDAYQPLPGMHINGQASLGENLADYGGILLGLDAFKETEQYKKGEKIAGLTPLQRFFLGYALGWQFQQKNEQLRQRLLSDVHAPPKWRVIGPLSNVPEFYQAFGVKPGQPMWRPDSARVQVW